MPATIRVLPRVREVELPPHGLTKDQRRQLVVDGELLVEKIREFTGIRGDQIQHFVSVNEALIALAGLVEQHIAHRVGVTLGASRLSMGVVGHETYHVIIRRVERKILDDALMLSDRNDSQAARALGLPLTTFRRRLKIVGIQTAAKYKRSV